MIASGNGIVSHNILIVASAISGILVTWLGLYFRFIRPLRKQHEARELEDAENRKRMEDFVHGTPGDGLNAPIVAAPLRLHAAEEALGTLVVSVDKLTGRMDESNGTGKRTEEMVKKLLVDHELLLSNQSKKADKRQREILKALKR